MDKRILFQGFYGNRNSGDDAFLEVAGWGAKVFWNFQNIKFLSTQMPRLLHNYDYLTLPRFKGHRYLQQLGCLTESSHFVSAGGSTFHSKLAWNNIKRNSILKKQINPNFKVGAIGVSLGPFKSIEAEKAVKNHLSKMDFLAVRDQKSFQIAQSFNLPYEPINAFDLAALLPKIYNSGEPNFDKEPSDAKIVGVSVCNAERYVSGNLANEQRRNEKILDLLKSIAKDSRVVFRFFIFNGNAKIGDRELTMSMVNSLEASFSNKVEVIDYLGDVKKTWESIKQCNVVVATRLHAGIFGCYARVPFFLVEYHRKCSDFLDDVGQKMEYRLNDADFDTSTVSNMILGILEVGGFDAPVNLNSTQELALRNFTMTSTFI